MTTTYDPDHGLYLDEADVRNEVARVFDVCLDCRACTDLCGVFPMMAGISGQLAVADAGLFTPAQQDLVVDQCVQCSLCALRCPYAPGVHELAIDFPALMGRQVAMRVATKQIGVRRRIAMRIAQRRAERPKNNVFRNSKRIGRL